MSLKHLLYILGYLVYHQNSLYTIDLLLLKYYPSKNYGKAWSDIKGYLLEIGFNHRQYSGYVSIDNISMTYVIQHIIEMSLLFKWLKYCVKEFGVTIVGDEFSLKRYINQENYLD